MSTKVDMQAKKQGILSIFSGTIVAIAITLVFILLFAVLLRFVNISDSWIFPVNQIIKVISMIIGAVVILKKHKNRGFLKGLLMGLIYFILSYIVFSILQGSISWNMSNFYDLMLTSLMGGLIGIIVVNILNK